jgi:hypothetical protein
MLAIIKPSINAIILQKMLIKVHLSLNNSLPCFTLLKQDQKQIETFNQALIKIIEATFKRNKQLLKLLIINYKAQQLFCKIRNQVLLNIFNKPTNYNIISIFVHPHKINYTYNIFYSIPMINLLSSLQKFILETENHNYLLIRKTSDANISHSFPNFQHLMLIRKCLDAFLSNKIESTLHNTTLDFRKIIVQNKTILIKVTY